MSTGHLDFEDFYLEYKDRCLVAVLVSVGDRDTAQELVAEAFARAWAAWPKVGRHPAPQAWVIRTALNVGVSRWRRHRREVTLPDLGSIDGESVAAEGGEGMDPGLLAALKRLPARQREVVALRLLLDLDTARTAEVLRIAPGTVQAHLGRAMATLRADVMPARGNGGSL